MLGIPALDASVKNRCTREHVIIAEKHSKLPGLVNYIIYSEFTIFIPGQRDPQVAADWTLRLATGGQTDSQVSSQPFFLQSWLKLIDNYNSPNFKCTQVAKKKHFEAKGGKNIIITQTKQKRMDVIQLASTWVGWPNGEKLASTWMLIWSRQEPLWLLPTYLLDWLRGVLQVNPTWRKF